VANGDQFQLSNQPAERQLPRIGPPRFEWATGNISQIAETLQGIVHYLPDQNVLSKSIAYYGEYLQPQLDLLARMIRPGDFIVQGSAGIGVHTLHLGRAVGPTGHMYLYESDSLAKHMLPQNLAANRVTNYTLMRRALGRNVRPPSNGSASAAAILPTACDDEIETIDGLQLERLDWLKGDDGIDVVDLIEGAANTLWQLRPKVFVAVATDGLMEESAALLRTFGYRTWKMATRLFHSRNFNRREDDIFDGRSVVALLGIPEEIEVDIELDECTEIS
jgi:hypothetical protein